MKDFIKKKMYLILFVLSFSTLFSAILYADPIYCENDSECPEGMICVIPGNFCMEPAMIICTEFAMPGRVAFCYIGEESTYGNYIFVDCIFTGNPANQCINRIYPAGI